MNRRTLVTFGFASVTLLIVTLTFFAIPYMQEDKDPTSEQLSTIQISLCIDYGNGTREWFNNTSVPENCNLLNATKLVAKVQYTYWPAYKASFVDVINGVPNKSSYFWMWYYWDAQENEWKLGPVGADRYVLKPHEVVMWRYEKPSM